MSSLVDLLVYPEVSKHFTSCFTKPVSALDCAEPIVFLQGEYERRARMAEGERGEVAVRVLVVRERNDDAEAMASSLEQFLRHHDWERSAEAWPWRVCGIDTGAPGFKERDASGRYVWQFNMTVTVAREI